MKEKIELLIAASDDHERCLDEAAVNFGALLYVLDLKGIVTVAEHDAAKIIIRAEMDQQEAEDRDRP